MTKRIVIVAVGVLALTALNASGRHGVEKAFPQTHQLKASPKTVAWGYYDAAAPPVLKIKSGDTVEVYTLITNSPSGLQFAGAPEAQVEQALKDIHKEVKRGPGGHILTGP